MSFSNAWKWKWSRSVSVWLFVTAYQAPPSMGFSRQEYWSGLPLPSPLNTSSLSLILTPPPFAHTYTSQSEFSSLNTVNMNFLPPNLLTCSFPRCLMFVFYLLVLSKFFFRIQIKFFPFMRSLSNTPLLGAGTPPNVLYFHFNFWVPVSHIL